MIDVPSTTSSYSSVCDKVTLELIDAPSFVSLVASDENPTLSCKRGLSGTYMN